MSDWTRFTVDRGEYSRNEEDRDIITVQLAANFTPDAGETWTVEIHRLDGYGRAGAASYVTAGDEDEAATVPLFLENCVDENGYYCARAGKYQAKVVRTDPAGAAIDTTDGPTFYVSVVTVDKLKEDWLFGIPLTASEVMGVLKQPQVLTGVRVKGTSQDHLRGMFALTYDSDSGTLAWGENSARYAITVPTSGTYYLPLADVAGREYLEVEVVTPDLPSGGTTIERLVVDYQRLTDDTMRDIIASAASVIQAQTAIVPEPTIVATPHYRDAGWYDLPGRAIAYTRARRGISIIDGRWLSVNLQHHYLLKILAMGGYIGDQRAMDIPQDWLTFDEKTALVELIPPLAKASVFQYFGTAINVLNTSSHVPQFWQFRAVFGLPDLRGPRDDVLHVIANKAAAEIALRVGEAFTGGRTSANVGRDGVSDTRSWNTPIPWAGRLKDWQESLTPKALRSLKRRIVGIMVTTLE